MGLCHLFAIPATPEPEVRSRGYSSAGDPDGQDLPPAPAAAPPVAESLGRGGMAGEGGRRGINVWNS